MTLPGRTVKLVENNLTAIIYKENTEILKLKNVSSHKYVLQCFRFSSPQLKQNVKSWFKYSAHMIFQG